MFRERLIKCVREALPKSGRLCLWLLKIILPISLAVNLLQHYGVINYIAEWLHPVFHLIGLPGATAIVFITSLFLPLYAAIAVLMSMDVTLREATLLALMCLVAHNLPVECAVTRKTGSSFWGMAVLRITMAFAVAIFLNTVLPLDYGSTPFEHVAAERTNSFLDVLRAWLYASGKLIITILLIVTALMIVQRILIEFRLMDKLSKPLRPLMRLFGLPDTAPFLWIVGNVVGLAYGGAVMADLVEEGRLTTTDSNTVNYHLSISHSLLEDTLLFVALGINLWIIVGTRLLFAMLVVWGRRLIISIYTQSRHEHSNPHS